MRGNNIIKNIGIVTHNLNGGGCERVIAELSNWFSLQGINCTIYTEYKSSIFYELNENINVIPLINSNTFKSKDIFIAYLRLRKYVKINKHDIILAMPEKVNVWTLISLIGTHIPVVVSERNNPYIYPRSKLKRLLRILVYPIFASGFIFQTIDAKNYFSKKIQYKSIILPNPINIKKLPPLWCHKREKEIVSVGRLVKQKNFHLLIKCFSIFLDYFDDYVLTIYGDGPLKNELIDYASKLLPKNKFRLPGKTHDVLNRINKASMFILSSNYEGLPNALIEAMSLGLPVISTNCPIGGPKSLINDGYNGILVPVNDEKSLTEAMIKIASNNELSSKLSENAIKIRNSLDINIVAINWLDYLTKIVNKEVK